MEEQIKLNFPKDPMSYPVFALPEKRKLKGLLSQLRQNLIDGSAPEKPPGFSVFYAYYN